MGLLFLLAALIFKWVLLCVCVWVGLCACGIAAMGALEDCFACLLVKRNKHCDVLDILLSLLFSPRASVRSLVTH